MKLAIYNDCRLGVLTPDEQGVVDVTPALPSPHDPDPVGAGWWVRLCRDWEQHATTIRSLADRGQPIALDAIRLRSPVLNPTKIVAAAANYGAHVGEMQEIGKRTGIGDLSAQGAQSWLLDFDIFLKAPSSIIGPHDTFLLPAEPLAKGLEVHHESELAIIIGRSGQDIPESTALEHVFGYTIGLDMTVRGQGDRSRRKSYDTFTPLGPWVVTADEISDPHALEIRLTVNGEHRQRVQAADMLVKVPGLIAYASGIMRLEPGDVILTGAPPGVGQVRDGDVMEASISRIGQMRIAVARR